MTESADEVKIVTYQPKYQKAFKDLNEEWITTYFKMEEKDYEVLNNPEEYIISKGGHIVFALINDEAVGTCALIQSKESPGVYELAKMAVSPKAQGKQIGYLIGKALIDIAKEENADQIFLETNSILVPAIRLYEKLGFKHVPVSESPYERCDVKMELNFD